MSKAKGDKARYNRMRVRKLERRVELRALRATLIAAAAATEPPKPPTES